MGLCPSAQWLPVYADTTEACASAVTSRATTRHCMHGDILLDSCQARTIMVFF